MRNFDWVKMTSAPLDLISLKRYDDAVNTSQRLIMGHTRLPTRGDVTNANTQPFLFPDTIGMHNGTLVYSTQKRLDPPGKYETDSEGLYAAINERGIENVIEDLSDGDAYALVWYDKTDSGLYMLRNNSRPLHFTYNEKRTVMYWASEEDMLRLCLNRRNVPFTNIFKVQENELHSWSIPDRGPFQAPTREKGYDAPHKYVTPKGNGTDFWEGWEDDVKKADANAASKGLDLTAYRGPTAGTKDAKDVKAVKEIKTALTSGSTERVQKVVYQVWDPKTNTWQKKALEGVRVKEYKGFNGELLTQNEYIKRTKDGCAWCSSVPQWPDNGAPDIVRFVNKNEHFCWECMANPSAQEAVSMFNTEK